MKMSPMLMTGVSAVFTPIAMAFIRDSIAIMLPWLFAMAVIIIADLASGLRKSLKLGVHVSWTTAARETMGKFVVYFAFVLAGAMVDVAASGHAKIARWSCLLVCALEGGSILSNLVRPYGIVLTPKSILKLFLKRSPIQVTDEEAEELLEELKEREDAKFNRRKN
jgi:hypothetical protein